MLESNKKEVLRMYEEEVFGCPACGMQYAISAIFEGGRKLKQIYAQYCPFCGTLYLGGKHADIFLEEEE